MALASQGVIAIDSAPPPPDESLRDGKHGWTGGRIVALIFGSLLSLFGIALLLGGGAVLWADRTQRDAAGFLTSGEHTFFTDTYALATDEIGLGRSGTHAFYAARLLDVVRIRVTPAKPNSDLFVGIGPEVAVERYLTGVHHAVVTDFGESPSYRIVRGGTPRTPPAAQHFWVRASAGLGTKTLRWPVQSGSWEVVVMNEHGTAGLFVTADVGAKIPSLLWIAVGLLIAGGVFTAGGSTLLIVAIRRARAR